MMKEFVKSALLISLTAAILGASSAQGQVGGIGGVSRPPTDPVFTRAVSLNNEQRGAEARALVDSVLRAAPARSERYAEALFWKGVLATTDSAAEMSYKQLVQDFPLHRRAEESLIRLSQLEMTRFNRVAAQRYLDRIIVEHPYGQYRARASYWRARLFFEENEIDRACAELGTARARMPDNDVELKTEIDYAARRCPMVPTPTQTAADRKAADVKAAADAKATADRKAADVKAAADRKAADAKAAADTKAAADRKAADTKAANTKAGPPPQMFSVQAAAFPLKANADAFVDALKSRGYDARVVGTQPPYRVWIGRFATRDEATALANELKSKGVSSGAFVVTAESR